MQWADLPGLFPGLPGPGRWLPLLQRHLELLVQAAERTRVTAVEPADAVRRHYAESLETWRVAVDLGGTPGVVVDVGSGGGFPGLVMACAAPETRFALVEPLQKRARLLEDLTAALGLENVTVHAHRAEDAGRGPLRESADLVTARAVAALPELLEYTAPFARPGGWLVLPKGSGLSAELTAAANAMQVLGCALSATVPMRPEVSETLALACLQKVAPTPGGYPRRPGLPQKRPL